MQRKFQRRTHGTNRFSLGTQNGKACHIVVRDTKSGRSKSVTVVGDVATVHRAIERALIERRKTTR